MSSRISFTMCAFCILLMPTEGWIPFGDIGWSDARMWGRYFWLICLRDFAWLLPERSNNWTELVWVNDSLIVLFVFSLKNAKQLEFDKTWKINMMSLIHVIIASVVAKVFQINMYSSWAHFTMQDTYLNHFLSNILLLLFDCSFFALYRMVTTSL